MSTSTTTEADEGHSIGPIDLDAIGRWHPYLKSVMSPITRFLWRIRIEGREHLPQQGPAIIAPNHISFLDSLFLMMLLPRRITFVGKAEYLDDWKTRTLFPAMGMIPLDRAGGKAAKAALDAAEQVLHRGQLFGIFPEGTRSRTGDLYKGHTGMARLSLATGAPIIPTGIVGTDQIQPPDAPMPRPFRPASITFGRPIEPERYTEGGPDRLVQRRITDEVMFEIRSLTGQRYVDKYATRTAQTAPTETARIESRDLVAAAS
ncbi:MAG: lysophospholipid acyltransferase family protein [Actinomycetota bacterium]